MRTITRDIIAQGSFLFDSSFFLRLSHHYCKCRYRRYSVEINVKVEICWFFFSFFPQVFSCVCTAQSSSAETQERGAFISAAPGGDQEVSCWEEDSELSGGEKLFGLRRVAG